MSTGTVRCAVFEAWAGDETDVSLNPDLDRNRAASHEFGRGGASR
jgi:hypothetical protein